MKLTREQKLINRIDRAHRSLDKALNMVCVDGDDRRLRKNRIERISSRCNRLKRLLAEERTLELQFA